MATIHGTCGDQFTAVRDTFASNFDRGLDIGASVAVIKDGELVVDLWGGTIDDAGSEWQQDTLVNVFSTTKTMCNLSALLCADRGLIDLDAPVATYWPDFKANGKENVLVRHLLSHTSGLSGWTEPLSADDLYDWEKCCDLLAAQATWWEPGTASGYHAITQGYLVGEVVRRVTGQSLGAFFRQELADPMGADIHIGTPAEHDERIAPLIPPTNDVSAPEGVDPDSVAIRTLSNPALDARQSFDLGWRRAEIPAANAQGNARSVAQVQSIVSHGGERNGTQFLSPATIDRIFESQSNAVDLVLGTQINFGIGYGIVSPDMPVAPTERGCFWGGWGGSVVLNDVDNRMTVAYVMNKMGEGTTGDERGVGLLWSAYANLNG